MFPGLSKTPLPAAFFMAICLVACQRDLGETAPTGSACLQPAIPISQVQGHSDTSPLIGKTVTVRGLVTYVDAQLGGVYIETPGSGVNSGQAGAASRAVFVSSSRSPGAFDPGTMIDVTGVVTELGEGRDTLTALADISRLDICSSAGPLPKTVVSLPIEPADREHLEAMRIELSNDSLTVTDVYRYRQGVVTLSGNGFQFVPTELIKPGTDARARLQQDEANRLSAKVPMTEHRGLVVSGSTLSGATGVMGHDGRRPVLLLEHRSHGPEPVFPSAPEQARDIFRFVGMNLYNYFNGDGHGGGFPTSRGADDLAEFHQQGQRIAAAIAVLDPHVVAVMELENDGFDDTSAAMDLVRLAEAATGGSWSIVRPTLDQTGDDEITVGLMYRSDMLDAAGVAHTLSGPAFELSRQPMAQVFRPAEGGESLLVVVNHLKSKGSCPQEGLNADQGDGQGCWNLAREIAAERMTLWSLDIASNQGVENVLILGDMNAYRLEDPINAIRRAGMIELFDDMPDPVYSFIYRGRAGTLDYAFVSPQLRHRVQNAFIWNVNAALPPNIDSALPSAWLRFSDHDPVVVDIRLHQSATAD